ncbi:MAG: NADPH-dependent FMN reductase [Ferruginibacter sp.]
MTGNKIKILGICGSLRPTSSASAVLNVVGNLFPTHVAFTIYNGIAEIPAFNDSNEIPVSVDDLIKRITEADGVFFCIPEYAFGVPGALKNALDWTVSSTAFSDKPVALITAASQGDKAHAALLLTLFAIGTKIEEGAKLVIPFIRTKLDENNQVKDIITMDAITKVVQSFLLAVESV